jgi:6-phosphogluconate dehydrogenase (decarboxylating)
MQIGMIGLGKMGMGMAQRLQRDGHRVVGFARSAGTRARAQEKGIEPADSIEAPSPSSVRSRAGRRTQPGRPRRVLLDLHRGCQ